MEIDQGSIEERLAQAMIDLRKGHSSISCSIQQKRDHLLRSIEDIKKEIDNLRKENGVLRDLETKIKSIRFQINQIRNIDAHLIPSKHDKSHDSHDTFVQTEQISSELPNIQYVPHKAEKFKINNYEKHLANRQRKLQETLRSLELAENRRSEHVLLKRSEYNYILNQVAGKSPKGSTSYQDMEIENNTNVPSTNVQPYYFTGGSTSTTTLTKMTTHTNSSNNGVRVHEECDDEGVMLLLSMKGNVYKCKCGKYLNSITEWNEHQRICSKSTEKTNGEQCPKKRKMFMCDCGEYLDSIDDCNQHQRICSKSIKKNNGEQRSKLRKVYKCDCGEYLDSIDDCNEHHRICSKSTEKTIGELRSKLRIVFKCDCGDYLDSNDDCNEHQRICSKSTEKIIGEQCQLCKKTFLTCVALNIHNTKKHNKKKVRTDSIMHCPCGQSFTAKWRQNCVHKLNSHGRHCKAFKERETQCSICGKGFIDRKSLEYHGLKAHKLAVPVSS